ncbi:MAG: hypothetical protein KZQ57_07455 [gamma proteobacterium symbiont of Lucinoma myriamae]|nr:hypothetical protein [gamma proteobacterium symbiont of Lucinoma myriamae]
MLSQKRKAIINTLTSVVIGAATLGLGGVVNAQQSGINTQKYQFPPADAVPQIQTQSAPAMNPAARPTAKRQPVRITQNYPRPYPAQRQAAPRAPGYGSAPYGRPRSVPMQAPFSAPMRSGPGAPPPYGMPYNNRPAYGNPYSTGPYRGGPYNSPYNRGSNNGPFGNNPLSNFGGGPFNGDSAPWETWPFGSRDSFWSRKEFPFKEQNPTDWFQPGDPKEGMAVMWDDLIAAPDDLGTMPGGWNVPSISVPNPVDLEDQLEKASKEIPDLIRVYND